MGSSRIENPNGEEEAPLMVSDETESEDEEEDEEDDDDEEEDGWCAVLCNPDPDESLSLDEVVAEERHSIDQSFTGRGLSQKSEPPVEFALAFSGGGIRAAAFQAGVLWRLAEMGKLRDVGYLTAVSGGGYIASAYASQVIAAEQPPSADQADRWYLKIVAETIVRMQANAGNFVRDVNTHWLPDGTWERSGFFGWKYMPRCCDTPILLVIFFTTLLVNPFTFLILVIIPTMEFVDIFFGSGMRAAICTFDESHIRESLTEYSAYGAFEWIIIAMLIATFLLFIIARICPAFQLEEPDEPGGRPRATVGYLIAYGLKGFMPRMTVIIFCLMILIVVATVLEKLKFCIGEVLHVPDDGESHLLKSCNSWVGTRENPGRYTEYAECNTVFASSPWYEQDRFINQTHETPCNLEWIKNPGFLFAMMRGLITFFGTDLLGAFTALIAFLFILSVLLLPISQGFLSKCIGLLGPLLIFALLLEFVQWRVFGPMLGDKLFSSFSFKPEVWKWVVLVACIIACLLIFCYAELRAILHVYYRRCLQNNFLHAGKDIRMKTLENPWCPLMLLTGMVSDFVVPGDTSEHRAISEISFTHLHEGSVKTGFTKTPRYRTLGKTMALSGAGCLDAISLSLSTQNRMRFWTEVLNLTWGDYILFAEKSWEAGKKCSKLFGRRYEAVALWAYHRLPVTILLVLGYVLIATAVIWINFESDSGSRCGVPKVLFLLAAGLIGGLLFCSYFTFWGNAVSFSPIMRTFHQLTSFRYTGNLAPELLYVTDGGALDCVTLMQLVMRKCKRILLVLANADPQDDLNVVKDAIKRIVDLKLASFFDPDDPRNDIKVLFDRFKRDKDMRYLRFGMAYGWPSKGPKTGGEEEYGNLIVVKNRLRPKYNKKDEDGNGGLPVPPLLSREEIMGMPPPQADMGIEEEGWQNLKQDELGGCCCCDRCHLLGCNCGAKFPHLTGANYLYLTPQLFNCLCRLGYNECDEGIEALLAKPLPRPPPRAAESANVGRGSPFASLASAVCRG